MGTKLTLVFLPTYQKTVWWVYQIISNKPLAHVMIEM